MPQQIRAVVVDPSVPGRLAIREVSLRDPDRDEVGVRVTAISLNRGETRRALQVAEVGWRPGWDFAGIVERAAADGSGPEAGTRVVGILPSGAWAERVNCRSHAVAVLPEAVSDAQAATLPVAARRSRSGSHGKALSSWRPTRAESEILGSRAAHDRKPRRPPASGQRMQARRALPTV